MTGTVRRLVDRLVRPEAPGPHLVVLFGPPGAGKSHRLREACRRWEAAVPGGPVIRASGREVVDPLIASARGTGPALADAWRGAGLVAIDDLHVMAGLAVTQREVALRLLDVAGSGVRVVGAAGCSRDDLPEFVAALARSPLAAVLDLERPSARVLGRIVRDAAREQGVRLSPRAVTAIARRADGDARRALGLVARARFEASVFSS